MVSDLANNVGDLPSGEKTLLCLSLSFKISRGISKNFSKPSFVFFEPRLVFDINLPNSGLSK